MTTVFDRMYKPGMSADEWHNLIVAVNTERRNDEYTRAYLASERSRKEIEDSIKASQQESSRIASEAYNKRLREVERIKSEGKRKWESDMREKWGW